MVSRTGIGAGIGIPFKNNALKGDKPYLPPEIKDSLKAVVIAYGKTNNDSDRAIVKNLVDASNPFVISNAAFKLNSGYGKYEEDFTSWDRIDASTAEISNDGSKIKCINTILNVQYLFNSINKDIPSFKVKISNFTKGNIAYYYRKEDGTEAFLRIVPSPLDKVLELPKSYNTVEGGTGSRGGFYSSNINIGVTIEQIPSFQGALVTDGVNDLITSTKTVQEMGITNEVTVVSMIHQINANKNFTTTNNLRNESRVIGRNTVTNIGKTGIYGWYKEDLKGTTATLISNILGDKNDYTEHYIESTIPITNSKFYVTGYAVENGFTELSSVAWYWTIIANKVLTSDQINQVIAYFNLDRCVEPTVLYDVKRQGLSNDTPDSDWYLKDYSGNGYDMTLYNYAKTPESGINEDGGLQSDGVEDYGKVTGLPIYKDYTVVADYERFNIGNIEGIGTPPVLSKSYTAGQGSFIMNFIASTGNSIRSYSFGAENTRNFSDLARQIFYQSKYKSQGFDITAGTGIDGDSLWLGTARDNDSRFFNGAIYSLMTFPYSMSEFLIERQLKKHKLGTLYPDMVEFRPVIKHDDRITAIKYYHIKGSSRINLKPGDYIPVGSKISITTNLKSPYTIANVMSSSLTDIKVVPSAGGGNAYDILGYVTDKSPQKITMDIQVDSSLVQWNPVVESNVPYKSIRYYKLGDSGSGWMRINIGDYITIGRTIMITIDTVNTVDELVSAVSSQLTGIGINGSNGTYNITGTLTSESPQNINITIDEYIRYEDIVQPYPVLLRFNDENGNEVSWGGKFRVGSTITRIGSAADSNLLPNIYNIFGLLLNDNQVTSSKVIVEKTMVFKAKSTYIFDNNEPKCILSPSRLRIPNSSYKILGYIPDISGHGNHGKINNSAYKLNSGVNGYLVDFTTLKDDGIKGIVRTDSKIYLDKSFNYNQGFWLGRTNNPSPAYKVKVSGIPETGMLTYTGGVWLNLVNGINELPARTNTEEEHGFVIQSPNLDWSNLVIEQIGEYEGAYCFDGVDDFVTIPTTVGGKQVLMKINWQNRTGLLYDQRKNGSSIDAFAILNVDSNNSIAYNSRNTDGETYIDGILNKNIVCPQLYKITHSITIINQLANKEEVISPTIGSDTTHKIYFSQMSLYDFMLFDDISTEAKIKELNEYVGIEAKVELPPYYWDAYGKTNLDADKATIQQRGVAVGNYDLTNYNHAYDKMSGYGGYSFSPFSNTNDWRLSSSDNTMELLSIDGYSFTARRLEGSTWWKYKNKVTTNVSKNLTIKIRTNKSVRINWELKYRTSEMPDADLTLGLVSTLLSPNVITDVVLPVKTEEELNTLGAISHFYVIFFPPIDVPVGEEYTVEMLPLYPNGLLYDAVTDYSENVNIPVFTDFTAIMKRKWLKNQGCPLIKGSKVYEGGNGNALLFEWDKAYNFVFYKRTDIMEGEVPENISFITPTNYNGNVITRGSEQDTNGICIAGDGNAGFANMVFYKLILYPKTIPLLQINFLKNLMERDEIIDLNNPIFIQE